MTVIRMQPTSYGYEAFHAGCRLVIYRKPTSKRWRAHVRQYGGVRPPTALWHARITRDGKTVLDVAPCWTARDARAELVWWLDEQQPERKAA